MTVSYNEERIKTFEEQYRAQLALLAADNPSYFMTAVPVSTIADRMLTAIKTNGIRSVNIDGKGFKRTAAALGIKKTYVSIEAYLKGD